MIYRYTWMLPVLMTMKNVLLVTAALIGESRLKPQAFVYIFLYANTILPAMKGDVQPFIEVLARPVT